MKTLFSRIAGVSLLLCIPFLTACSNWNSASYTPTHGGPYTQAELIRFQKVREHRPPSYSYPSYRQATGRSVFIYDPKYMMYGAYDANGRLVKQGRASGGGNYCLDTKRPCRTPVGNFAIYRKGGPNCKSSKYPLGKGGAPMPHCNFFHGGYAIHGSPYVPWHNASHGCIRLYPSDAQWLDNNHFRHGTQVIVRPYT